MLVHSLPEQDRVDHVGDQLGQLVIEVPARGREEAPVAPAVTDGSHMWGEPRRPVPERVELLRRLDSESFFVQPPGSLAGQPISRHGPNAVPAGYAFRSCRHLLATIR